MTDRYFHGTQLPFDVIDPDAGFGGLFFSATKQSAASHGNLIYAVDIPDEDILSHYQLNYEVPYDDVAAAFSKVCPYEELWDYVVEEDDLFGGDLEPADFGYDDFGELSWACQGYRCRLAAELGYSAVEMSDEHGVSYCVNELAPTPFVLEGGT